MRINHEVGCIYDTLAFLTLYVAESVNYLSENTFTESLTYYRAIREAVQSKVVIHSYLNPFFVRQKNSESFLYSIFFNRPYRECTFDRLKQILSNRLHMKKCFIAYCFPEADESTLNKLLYMEHPDVIDILTQRSMDIVQERNFIYILMNEKRACQELADVVIEVYSIIDAYKRSELPSAYGKALEQESVFSKLKAITGAKEVWDKDFTVSMSIMDANLFSFRVDERDFVLLGYDFEKRLDTDYKYSDVTLYSFA